MSREQQKGQHSAKAFYDRQYHSKRHPHLLEDDVYFWARAKASTRLYFTPIQRKARVFEYGCGIGQGIACLPRGAGWDISHEARRACRRRNIRIYDRLGQVPRGAWDIVFCRHTLEHIEQPLRALRQMRQLLRPQGQLFLVLPMESHRPAPFDPDLDQHLYCWNFRTINNLVSRAGFHPIINETSFVLGYRALLPLRRIAGETFYYWATKVVGSIYRNGELIVRAKLSGK